ncbi:hypothetical protein GCM10023169_32800 [Georgenia halophila]|uniref:DUF3515 family protein n=1 Tax=Georgenia halophila TaxID=620889 RepID=A0ABP8LHQ5_9MICO
MLMAGCSAPVDVTAGPHAAAPACGQVMVASPDTLLGADRRDTASQATTAWGDPPVTLRCGVEVPGPTTDRCISVETSGGSSVDWVSLQQTDELEDGGEWTFVTYGREPAIEVVVPVEQVGGGQVTAYLAELGEAASLVPAERSCVGAEDVS